MRKCFLALLLIATATLLGCGADEEVINPEDQANTALTQGYAELLAEYRDAPTAPPIRGGWQDMSCVEFNNGIHEWASIRVTEGSGTNALNRHIVVHASLLHIPSGQNYVIILTPQGFYSGFSFDFEGDTLKFHRTLAAAKEEVRPIHLFQCNTSLSDATHIVYEAEEFEDDRTDKSSLAEVLNNDGTLEQSVHVLPIGDVDTINFAGGQIINSNLTLPDTVTYPQFAESYITATELKDRTRVMFFSSQADAEAYAAPMRIRRTLFEGRGKWYSIGLYVKAAGVATGTVHHGPGDSGSGFERIQFIPDSEFPETDAEKGIFIRDQFTSNAWRTGFDNGTTYFKFSEGFQTEMAAADVDHLTAARATTYTGEKLDLRVDLEPGFRTATAQRDRFVGGSVGSGFAGNDVGLYTANNIVKGVMVVDGNFGLPNTVTLGGVALTEKSEWKFADGEDHTAIVDELKEFFGFSNTWGRTGGPSALTRVDPAPALLVYNTTNMTLTVGDPLNLYTITGTHKIKWYASTTAATTAKTTIETSARIYTYGEQVFCLLPHPKKFCRLG